MFLYELHRCLNHLPSHLHTAVFNSKINHSLSTKKHFSLHFPKFLPHPINYALIFSAARNQLPPISIPISTPSTPRLHLAARFEDHAARRTLRHQPRNPSPMTAARPPSHQAPAAALALHKERPPRLAGQDRIRQPATSKSPASTRNIIAARLILTIAHSSAFPSFLSYLVLYQDLDVSSPPLHQPLLEIRC